MYNYDYYDVKRWNKMLDSKPPGYFDTSSLWMKKAYNIIREEKANTQAILWKLSAAWLEFLNKLCNFVTSTFAI